MVLAKRTPIVAEGLKVKVKDEKKLKPEFIQSILHRSGLGHLCHESLSPQIKKHI